MLQKIMMRGEMLQMRRPGVQIERRLGITQFRVASDPFAPYMIFFGPKERGSFFTMNLSSALKNKISLGADLVSKKIGLSICSRQLQPTEVYSRGPDELRIMLKDFLQINQMRRAELPWQIKAEPSPNIKPTRVVNLVDFSSIFTMIGPRDAFSPFYKVSLYVSDEEYEACKTLPVGTVFTVKFVVE